MEFLDKVNDDQEVIIDLDDGDSSEEIVVDWDLELTSLFNENAGGTNLVDVMKVYIKSITEKALHFEDIDTLKVMVEKHIKHIYWLQSDLDLHFSDTYLDNMEHIMTFYLNLTLRSLLALKRKMKVTQNVVSSTTEKIINGMSKYLLHSEYHIFHVLIRQTINSSDSVVKDVLNILQSNICKHLLKNLFKHYLFSTPIKDKSDEAFCRVYIIFENWKAFEGIKQDEHIDKLMRYLLGRGSECIKNNKFLTLILKPQKLAIGEINKAIGCDPEITTSYFDYIKHKICRYPTPPGSEEDIDYTRHEPVYSDIFPTPACSTLDDCYSNDRTVSRLNSKEERDVTTDNNVTTSQDTSQISSTDNQKDSPAEIVVPDIIYIDESMRDKGILRKENHPTLPLVSLKEEEMLLLPGAEKNEENERVRRNLKISCSKTNLQTVFNHNPEDQCQDMLQIRTTDNQKELPKKNMIPEILYNDRSTCENNCSSKEIYMREPLISLKEEQVEKLSDDEENTESESGRRNLMESSDEIGWEVVSEDSQKPITSNMTQKTTQGAPSLSKLQVSTESVQNFTEIAQLHKECERKKKEMHPSSKDCCITDDCYRTIFPFNSEIERHGAVDDRYTTSQDISQVRLSNRQQVNSLAETDVHDIIYNGQSVKENNLKNEEKENGSGSLAKIGQGAISDIVTDRLKLTSSVHKSDRNQETNVATPSGEEHMLCGDVNGFAEMPHSHENYEQQENSYASTPTLKTTMKSIKYINFQASPRAGKKSHIRKLKMAQKLKIRKLFKPFTKITMEAESGHDPGDIPKLRKNLYKTDLNRNVTQGRPWPSSCNPSTSKSQQIKYVRLVGSSKGRRQAQVKRRNMSRIVKTRKNSLDEVESKVRNGQAPISKALRVSVTDEKARQDCLIPDSMTRPFVNHIRENGSLMDLQHLASKTPTPNQLPTSSFIYNHIESNSELRKDECLSNAVPLHTLPISACLSPTSNASSDQTNLIPYQDIERALKVVEMDDLTCNSPAESSDSLRRNLSGDMLDNMSVEDIKLLSNNADFHKIFCDFEGEILIENVPVFDTEETESILNTDGTFVKPPSEVGVRMSNILTDDLIINFNFDEESLREICQDLGMVDWRSSSTDIAAESNPREISPKSDDAYFSANANSSGFKIGEQPSSSIFSAESLAVNKENRTNVYSQNCESSFAKSGHSIPLSLQSNLSNGHEITNSIDYNPADTNIHLSNGGLEDDQSVHSSFANSHHFQSAPLYTKSFQNSQIYQTAQLSTRVFQTSRTGQPLNCSTPNYSYCHSLQKPSLVVNVPMPTESLLEYSRKKSFEQRNDISAINLGVPSESFHDSLHTWQGMTGTLGPSQMDIAFSESVQPLSADVLSSTNISIINSKPISNTDKLPSISDSYLEKVQEITKVVNSEEKLYKEALISLFLKVRNDEESEARLPLKKRKLSIPVSTTSNTTSCEVSYPATPMLSIADLFIPTTSKLFKTPAEKKQLSIDPSLVPTPYIPPTYPTLSLGP